MGQPEQNTNNQNEIGGLFLWQQTDQLEIILEWEQLEVDRRYIIRQRDYGLSEMHKQENSWM